jgi:hypothetical protein
VADINIDNVGDDLAKAFDDGFEQGKKATMQWVSVKDRLPEKKGRYLTCDHKGNIHILNHFDFYTSPFGISKPNGMYNMVTHWMPLPEPPGGKR